MSEHELEKLLGGFATNTLTVEERSRLYKAAMQDQQLFNALADEQALKELLSDPAVRRRLLQALTQPDAPNDGKSLRWWAWLKRPAGLAVAGGLAAAIFAIAFGTRIYHESLDQAAQPVATETATPARPAVQAPPPAISTPPSEPEPQLKAQQSDGPPIAPTKKETLTEKFAKRERSAPVTPQEQRASESLSDSTMPPRERDDFSKHAPASADRKLAVSAPPPTAAPAPTTAQAPSQAPIGSSEASTAPSKSARALFYGEEPARNDPGGTAQESKHAVKPAAESTLPANRLERKMDQFAGGNTASGATGQVKPFGLRYSFVTRGSDGQSQEVSAATVARTKEPVRITVEATQDAYMQMLQNLGSAGTRLWWPPQETGKISLKLLAGKRTEIPLPPPAESGLLNLIIRLSPKPFGPLTMQEVGMLDRFSANLLTQSVTPGGPAGAEEQATYVVSQDSSTATQIAVEIPITQ